MARFQRVAALGSLALALTVVWAPAGHAQPLVPGTPADLGACIADSLCVHASYDNTGFGAVNAHAEAWAEHDGTKIDLASAEAGADLYAQERDQLWADVEAAGLEVSAHPIETVAESLFHGDMPGEIAHPPTQVKGNHIGSVEVPHVVPKTNEPDVDPEQRSSPPTLVDGDKPAPFLEATSLDDPPMVTPPKPEAHDQPAEPAPVPPPSNDAVPAAMPAAALAASHTTVAPPADLPLAAALSGLALVGLMTRPAWGRLGWIVSALYARLDRAKIVSSRRRGQILDFVAHNPWSTRRQLQEATGLSRSSVRHHVAALRRHRLVAASNDGVETRFALPAQAAADAYIARPRRLLTTTLAPGPRRLSNVLREMMTAAGYTRSGAWKAVRRLVQQGHISVERRGSEVWIRGDAPGPPRPA